MKTQLFRVSALALSASMLVLATGCQEGRAQAEVPVFQPTPVLAAAPAEAPQTPTPPDAAPEATPAVKVVQAPVVPDKNLSPALAEVVKLVQAGVSEEVIMAYITNSPQPFNATSDQIVYLNDLGLSSPMITALLAHDSPARALAKNATPGPLPPSVTQTAPPPNVAVAPPPEEANAVATAPLVPPEQAADTAYFYSSLAPYGSWVDVAGYGLCWRPTVAVINAGWRPYGDSGRWIWTDAGWYWYSDYSWGWAPFHYGRWCSYPRIGWFWVPDRVWGPSWVSWRYTSSYCGWAPLPPAARFVSGVGFTFHGGAVGVGFEFGLAPSLYTFVPFTHFHDRHPFAFRAPVSQTTVIYHNSTVINNYVVQNNTVINHGVGVERVSRLSGTKIQTVSIQPATHTVGAGVVRHEEFANNGRTLTVVRPNLASVPVHETRGTVVEPVRAPSVRSGPAATAPASPRRADPAPSRPGVRPRREASAEPIRVQESHDSVPARVQEPAATSRLAPATSASQGSTPAQPLQTSKSVGQDPPVAKHPQELAEPARNVAAPNARTAPALERPQAQARTTLLPPVGQPTVSQPAAPERAPTYTAPLTPAPNARAEVSRNYTEPGNSRPANPRFEAGPGYGRPQFGAAREASQSAPPTYVAPHGPAARPEVSHGGGPPAGVSHAAPSRVEAAPRGGNRKE
jgi:hypothetical protein